MKELKNNQIKFNFISDENGLNISGNGLIGSISVSMVALEKGKVTYVRKIGDFKFIDDNEGVIDFEKFTKLNSKLIESFLFNYIKNYEIGFNLIVVTELNNEYKSFVGEILIKPKWIDISFEFEGIDYGMNENFYIPPISSKATDLKLLTMDFKTKELEYNKAKAVFEAEVKNNTDIGLEVVNGYEPNTFTKVITRMLEFQRGTLNPAIEFTKLANLKKENNNLTAINNLINTITNMYPKIDIKMGEGMPYK